MIKGQHKELFPECIILNLPKEKPGNLNQYRVIIIVSQPEGFATSNDPDYMAGFLAG